MDATSKTKELISKYGLKITVKEELTSKANHMKIALANDPKVAACDRLVKKLSFQ